MRIGFGYDVHRLSKGRKLILGGVEIKHTKGLLGHSDADVLLHSICDSLLGAAGLNDIGYYFPNTDEKWKDVVGRDGTNSRTIRPNFATTNPRPMTVIPVLTHARYVLSLARWSDTLALDTLAISDC